MSEYYHDYRNTKLNYVIDYTPTPGFDAINARFRVFDSDLNSLIAYQDFPLEATAYNIVTSTSGSMDLSLYNLVHNRRYRIEPEILFSGYSGSLVKYYEAFVPIQDPPQFRYWTDPTNPSVESLGFNANNARFNLSNSLYVEGNLEATGTLTAGTFTSSEIRSNSDVYVNYNGPDGTSYLYFYETSSPIGAFLNYNNTVNEFQTSHGLQAAGHLKAHGNMYINYDGLDGQSSLYFYENSSETGAELRWRDATTHFRFSHPLEIAGTALYMNSALADADQFIYFREGASDTGAAIKFNDTEARFDLTHPLEVTGALGAAGITGTSVTSTGTIVATNDITSSKRIIGTTGLIGKAASTISGSLFVTGNTTVNSLRSNTNIYANYDGADADSFLYFYEGASPTGAYLQWDNAVPIFKTSHGLMVNTTTSWTNTFRINNTALTSETAFLIDAGGLSIRDQKTGRTGSELIFAVRNQADTKLLTVKYDGRIDATGKMVPVGGFVAKSASTISGSLFVTGNVTSKATPSIINVYANSRLVAAWAWQASDNYLNATAIETTAREFYIYLSLPNNVATLNITTYSALTLDAAVSRTNTLLMDLERATTTGAWTSIGTVSKVFTQSTIGAFSSNDTNVLTGFTLNWDTGARYRLRISRTLNNITNVTSNVNRVFGVSIA